MAGIVNAIKGLVSIIDLLQHFLDKQVKLILQSSSRTIRLRPTIYELVVWKRIAEGKVHSITENPPTILLKDVKEYVFFETSVVEFMETGLRGSPIISKALPTSVTHPQKFYLVGSIKEIEPV